MRYPLLCNPRATLKLGRDSFGDRPTIAMVRVSRNNWRISSMLGLEKGIAATLHWEADKITLFAVSPRAARMLDCTNKKRYAARLHGVSEAWGHSGAVR